MLVELVKGTRNVIPTPLTPDRGHVRTGEVVERSQFGKVVELLVYREPKPLHMRGRAERIKDPDTGRPLEREGVVKGQRGAYTYVTEFVEHEPVYTDEGDENPNAWREYILEPDGKGGVYKNFNFREDPVKAAARAAEKEAEAHAKRLMEILGKADPAKVQELLMPDGTPVQEEEAAEEEDDSLPDGFEIDQTGRWYYATYNGERITDKGLPTRDAVLAAIEQWRLNNA